jgi:uncharacterized repeat protein (TIGR03803 family)
MRQGTSTGPPAATKKPYGAVYKLDTAGHETVLHNFVAGDDGVNPTAGVILDSSGSLYGTTSGGGNLNGGVVFELKP